MSFESVIKRLQEGPAILMLGQNYLALESGKDHILQKIIAKYSSNEQIDNISYKLLANLNLSIYSPEIFQWLEGLCKSISTPTWLEEISIFPWAAVYTSAIDTILERPFESGNRSVQPIVNDRYLVNDPRNRNHLHITYLMGYIRASENSDLPPLKQLDFAKRRNVTNALLSRLTTLITPRGLLVIEGYGLNDQLTIDDLYTYTSTLEAQQILICSASKELLADERVSDLVTSGKAVVTEDSFASLFIEWTASGKLKFETKGTDDYYGKWLTLPQDRVKLPDELISKVSRGAFIPDDSIFWSNEEKTDEERYTAFRRFLSSSNVLPDWEGYKQGFAFERDYYQTLKSTVVNAYLNREESEKPIILFGQTSSGKTTSLGLLTYELRTEYKYPVLFIPKRYQRGDEMSIDLFCRWAEDNKAKGTIIIWDGMLDAEPYYKLLRFLNSRGRNIILVCSCYITEIDQDKVRPTNYIEAPIDLVPAERNRFINFVKSVNPLLASVIKDADEPNLLALLYRYLPTNLASIRSGLHDEYNFFVNLLSNQKSDTVKTKTDLYDLFTKAGIVPSESGDDDILSKPLFLASETITVADFLTFSIMVPGQYGLNVPFELLLDAIGFDSFATHIFKAMNTVNLIKWYDDEDGNIELGPRTTLEAKILARYAGGKRSEIDYISGLLERVRTEAGKEFGAADRQIEFAVQLLNEIGPNSTNAYFQSYYQITEILRMLREDRYAYHPRLVLKEAMFLRAIVKRIKDYPNIEETSIELLERAESMVRQALNDLGNNSGRMIASYLRVELSTISGFLAQYYINEPDIAKEYYWQVRHLNNYSFSTNPGNYLAVDIAAWTTERLLSGGVFTPEEKVEAETDLLSLFEMVEAEGISEEHQEDFQARKIKFYEILGNTPLADEIFESMRAKGFTHGIYLRARNKLGFEKESEMSKDKFLMKNKEAFKYLFRYFDEIKHDGRCLFLLLKTWWISTSRTTFFEGQNQAIAFENKEWDFCMQITSLLLSCEERYQTATVYYLLALSQFHLDFIKPAMQTFEALQAESFAYGRKRVAKFYMLSTPSGGVRVFSGEVKENVSRSKYDKRGNIYVSELGISIPFSLYDFGQNSFQKGDRISAFNIAFNFLGPIAVPVKK
ncbi:hypothetical protein E2P86_10400 [Sphingobacterium psychroaquaticum]|uniref:hypothetical protein n=1 Tax=Sphingobacterium psychroaquaticum TaxID=561061 RepID=UPI00106D413B|nr:hypothetical protein [Sphingobacterium psychroaquaticum]QBQ41537.1 hypothetical protein E2P86_10400 [Sphingobacterium psychroaquaticum]